MMKKENSNRGLIYLQFFRLSCHWNVYCYLWCRWERLLPMVSFFLPLVLLPLVQFSNQKQEFLPMKLRNGRVVEWEWIFQRKVMFSCRSRSAEFQMSSFLAEAELRKFKSQYIVRNCGASSHILFCVWKQNCWTSRHSIFLVRKRNCETSSHRIFFVRRRNCELKVKALVWKRNCETSKSY